MSSSGDQSQAASFAAAGELRDALVALRREMESLQRLEPLFVETTAVLRMELQALYENVARLSAATTGEGGGAPSDPAGLRAELRHTLHETTELLRTRLVEEMNELRGELQSVLARLNDRRFQDRAELRTSLDAGSDSLRSALAEDAAGVRAEIEAVRAQLKEQQVADQQLLRAELRASLREWNEHLRTRIVEEATELRAELHQVRGILTDQQTQHRSDIKAALGEGLAQVMGALAESTSALRTEVAFLRDQLATREMVTGALAHQEQQRSAVMAEIEWLRADVRVVPTRLDEEHAAIQGELTALRERVDALTTRAELREAVAAWMTEESTALGRALAQQADRLRAELQAVWSELNDQHTQERAQLDATVREIGEQVRASLLVELTEFFQSQVNALARSGAASLTASVEKLQATISNSGTEAQARHDRVVADVALIVDRLTGLHLELEGWRQHAIDERSAEVEALLAAVGGNEERLHHLFTTELAAGREEAQAAFATAAQERQAQLAYLEAALQTFNQALALEREEVRALITWSQEATDAAVTQLGGRLDALGRMLSRLLSGEGVLEVTEAVAAIHAELARISRKLPARSTKATAESAAGTKRTSRAAPPSQTRRPARGS